MQPKSPPSPAGMICGPLGHEDRRPLAFWGKDIGLTGKKIMDRVSEGNYTRSVPAGRPSPPCHLIGIREGLSVSALSLLWHTYLETARRLHSTPMCALVADLKRRGVVLARLRALDVFGGHGRTQTVDFAAEVASLEAWEVCARKEESLRRNLPNAEIKIVDSFVEIKTTDRKFGFIVVDAPNALFGENDERCEHFDLFADVMRLADPPAIVVLNVMPRVPWDVPWRLRRTGRGFFGQRHLARRSDFYRTDTPENVPFDRMISVYRDLVRQGGGRLDWHLFKRKSRSYYYLALAISGGGRSASRVQ